MLRTEVLEQLPTEARQILEFAASKDLLSEAENETTTRNRS